MLNAVYTLLGISTLLPIICIFVIGRMKGRTASLVKRMTIVTAIICLLYFLFTIMPTAKKDVAMVFLSLYFGMTDILALYFLLLVLHITDREITSKAPKIILGTVAGLDFISFFINIFTKHAFSLASAYSTALRSGYWVITAKFPRRVHLMLVYIILVYSMVMLLISLIKSPKIYKMKYNIILVEIVIFTTFSVMFEFSKPLFDYTVFLYPILLISICQQVLFASPKKLLEKINAAINKESVIGMFCYDDHGKFVSANDVAVDFFSDKGNIEDVAEAYLREWDKRHQRCTDEVIYEEQKYENAGETRILYITYQRFADEKDRKIGTSIQFEDRTEMVEKYEKEKYISTHDELTGLLNRSAFEQQARELLDNSDEEYLMICSNIKDFKIINDIFGINVGNRLIMAEAEQIKLAGGNAYPAARIFADRFSMLLPKSSYEEKRFINGIKNMMHNAFVGENYRLRCLVGVYEFKDNSEPVLPAYDKAVMAMQSLNSNYEKMIAYFNEDMLADILKEKNVMDEFDRALNNQEFCLFLQPQVYADGKLLGAEALVRWRHPEKGIVSPGLFIPILEKTGMIYKLDKYVWNLAAMRLAEWEKSGIKHTISVNISTKDFYFLDIFQEFKKLHEKYGYKVANLKLEITESAIMEDVEKNIKIIEALQEYGYQIEIDDFGSGYSSLGMLKDIKVDVLKIDMMFLRETENHVRSRIILKNVISMAKDLGMLVITEGVESKEQVDFLTLYGCDIFQGYYFSKPIDVTEFEWRWLGTEGV